MPNAPGPLSIGADIQTHLWLDHKEAGAEAKAKDLLSRAKAAEAKTDERFGAEALSPVGRRPSPSR